MNPLPSTPSTPPPPAVPNEPAVPAAEAPGSAIRFERLMSTATFLVVAAAAFASVMV